MQAQADMDLDQDEVDDAKEDLARAGGSLADRIQALKKEHEEAAHSSRDGDSHRRAARGAMGPGASRAAMDGAAFGKVAACGWQSESRTPRPRLWRHNTMPWMRRLEEQKEKSPELAHHSKKRKDATPIARTPASQKSQEESAALLQKNRGDCRQTRKRCAASTSASKRTRNFPRFMASGWICVAAQQWTVFHRAISWRADHPGDRAGCPVFQHVDEFAGQPAADGPAADSVAAHGDASYDAVSCAAASSCW